MYIQVKLLNGAPTILTYKVPDGWNVKNLVGSLVRVPLKNRLEIAFVQEVAQTLVGPTPYIIREALDQDLLPLDPFYPVFIKKLSSYYCINSLYFFKRIHQFLKEKEATDLLCQEETLCPAVTLTQEQKNIVDSIGPVIGQNKYYPALIHGVTASGKTEIYKQLMLKSYECGKTSLLLLPEVSLAVQFTKLLKQQLPSSIAIFGFHSATSIKEKRNLWQSLIAKKPMIIIGVHLPMLLPIPELGLIIVDEEHEPGFQEKKHPKINTKEAALIRAQLSAIPIILGSATPSLTSLYNTKHRGWHFFDLKHRFQGAFPQIVKVNLTTKQPRKNFFISGELEKAIHDNLKKKEQTILFLNRRGYSFFVQCRKCSFIAQCKNCSVSLTLHNNQVLKCHYCNFSQPELFCCPACKAGAGDLLKKGMGTQQLVTVLEKMFPHARIARADLDSTVNKKKWQLTVGEFEKKNIDILVGTQTITKGYHFPGVTLVGIIWADINLSIPFYNASETTLAQLIQVAGRAGRQTKESKVIIQHMMNHPLFNYVNELEYLKFYDHELALRKEVGYPPCLRLAEIELKHESLIVIDQEADALAAYLNNYKTKHDLSVTLLGPAEPPVAMIKNTHSRKFYLKCQNLDDIIRLYRAIPHEAYTSSLFFTPNPLN